MLIFRYLLFLYLLKFLSSNIVGDRTSTYEEVPYNIAIQVLQNRLVSIILLKAESNAERDIHLCTGILITNAWALTAAHCTRGASRVLPEVYNTWHILSSNCCVVSDRSTESTLQTNYGKSSKILYWRIHRNYEPNMLLNDILMIRLHKPFDVALAFPISLSAKKYTNFGDIAEVFPECWIVGWGNVKEYKKHDFQPVLSAGTKDYALYTFSLPIMKKRDCDYYMLKENGVSLLDHRVVCGIFGKENETEPFCLRNLGAPLLCGSVDKTILVGVMSFGSGCEIGRVEVFTRIDQHESWINGIIHGHSSKTICSWTILVVLINIFSLTN